MNFQRCTGSSLALLKRLSTCNPVVSIVAAWLAVVTFGFGLLLWHQGSAGEVQEPPRLLPASVTHLAALSGGVQSGPILLLFAHPQCPCTRASLRELARLVAQAVEKPKAVIVFPRYAVLQDAWDAAPIVQAAQNLPEARILWDDEGQLAQRLGVRTSGHVLLYNAAGQLRFSGGITPLRGHEGDSTGKLAILAHLRGETAAARVAPVFGCSLVVANHVTAKQSTAKQ